MPVPFLRRLSGPADLVGAGRTFGHVHCIELTYQAPSEEPSVVHFSIGIEVMKVGDDPPVFDLLLAAGIDDALRVLAILELDYVIAHMVHARGEPAQDRCQYLLECL